MFDLFEIRLYHADGGGEKSRIILKQPLDLKKATLFYQQAERRFCIFSGNIGTAIVSTDGDILFYDPSFAPQKYDEQSQQFIRHDKKRLSIYKIE